MAVEELESPPVRDPIVVFDSTDPRTEKMPKTSMHKNWVKYLSNLVTGVLERPARKATTYVSAQQASIAVTPLPLGSIPPGVWRICLTVRVTRAGTVSSAIQASVTWTQGGVTQTESTANLNANTTTTRASLTVIARVDDTTPISYSTTYASAGATAMQYELDVVAEALAMDSTS